MRNLIFIFFIIIFISSCTKEENIEDFFITHISTNPTEITEFQENIQVRISYQHPEGFLGFYDPDYLSLEIKDSRLENPDYYHLNPLNPPNQSVSIVGEIFIEIDAPFVFGNGNSESLNYAIRIQDQSGTWSNLINTSTVIVNK
tara:strand:+ start:636 stop:1067 length:432 start_codon:yes stop_codon:yes gene_type:complete